MTAIDAAIGVVVVIVFAAGLAGAAMIVADKQREYDERQREREQQRDDQ